MDEEDERLIYVGIMEMWERDNENFNLKCNVLVLILNVEFDGLIVCRKKFNDKVKEILKFNMK